MTDTDSDSKSMKTVECDCCGSECKKDYLSYYYSDDIHMCPSCKTDKTDHQGLMDGTIGKDKIRQGLSLRVTVDVHKRGHDDPDDFF